MTSGRKRAPASFDVGEPQKKSAGEAPKKPRMPVAIDAAGRNAVTIGPDVFEFPEEQQLPDVPKPRRGIGPTLLKLFVSATALIVSAALGLWVDGLVRDLFARADWLGWTAVGVVAVAVLSLFAIVLREWMALARLSEVTSLRERSREAAEKNDQRMARNAVSEVASLLAERAETARGRSNLEAARDDIIDGANLVALAERELLVPLDNEARRLVMNAAKRVSMVTAVSPRAIVDVGYVLFESARLVRSISSLYGGRPGTLGFLRLAGNVAGHLAVTGSVAVGDTLIQQLVGHGLAAKLSARLGEGIVNGMMTVRIGISAIDLCRPMPFAVAKRPGAGDFLTDLVSFSRSKSGS